MLHGLFGEIREIECDNTVETVVIREDTDLTTLPPAQATLIGIPENCPRLTEFDPENRLGCISCSFAMIEFADGTIEI